MIDAICPACGRGGSLPKEKVNTRLVCRNCQQVFHVTTANVALKGEPPPSLSNSKTKTKPNAERSPRREDMALDFSTIRGPFKSAAVGLVLLVLAWFGYPYFVGGPETLEQRSIRAAQAIVDQNDPRLQKLVPTTLWDDAKPWLTELRPRIENYKSRWPGHDLNVSALVLNENRSSGRATVVAYLSPPLAAARTGSATGDIVVDSSGKTEPLGITLAWILDSSNQWGIDPKESAKADGR